jgi:putative tricarboxylic transport membrane protein
MPQVKDVRRPHADALVGIAAIVFCVLVYAATYAFDDVSPVISQGMGPEAFPRLVLAVMALLGALLVWQSRAREPDVPEPVPAMVIYTTLLFLGFMLGIALVGMLASMFLLAVAMGRLWGERRLLSLCAAAAVLCLAIWGIFVRGFSVPLPGGLAARLIS